MDGKLADTLTLPGHKSSETDADVWTECNFNPNGETYYNYILCYIDDFIHISFQPKEDMDKINIIYRLKECFGTPDRNLGGNVEDLQLEDGWIIWSTNCIDYFNSAI